MAKILVTGGAGFIGSHTVALLARQGHQVSIIDNLSTGKRVCPNARLHVLDISSEQVKEVFLEERPDYAILLAAQVGVGPSRADPLRDAQTNILGTINLLENCVRFCVHKVVLASSAAVYGPFQDRMATEESEPCPISFYGLSKLTAEKYVRMFQRQHGLPYTILRYSNVYGMGQETSPEPGVAAKFLMHALGRQSPVVYGDGSQTRDFVFVRDVARANLAALTSGNEHTVNISSGCPTTVNSLLKIVSDMTGTDLHPLFAPKQECDISHSTLDNTKAASILGWRPETDLRRGLQQTLGYLRSTATLDIPQEAGEEPNARMVAIETGHRISDD